MADRVGRRTTPRILALLMVLIGSSAHADTGRQTPLQTTLEGFLLEQSASLPGQVSVEVTLPDHRSLVCRHPQPFMPGNGALPWGRTTVGVRCPGDRPATRYFQAYISVTGSYLVAARTLSPGETISAADIAYQTGELTRLSRQILTDEDAVLGQVTSRRIGEGMPLQAGMVNAPTLVERGSRVELIARGAGFAIHGSGLALNDAGRSETVRVRTSSGKTLSGIATGAGTVEVP